MVCGSDRRIDIGEFHLRARGVYLVQLVHVVAQNVANK